MPPATLKPVSEAVKPSRKKPKALGERKVGFTVFMLDSLEILDVCKHCSQASHLNKTGSAWDKQHSIIISPFLRDLLMLLLLDDAEKRNAYLTTCESTTSKKSTLVKMFFF